MLYVFHVDVGRMMSFDMTVALSSVENLKNTIERLHSIPASNIVLLVSGGEMLTQHTQVSCYSAGTDTNPIYMFLTGDATLLPPALAQQPSELDMDVKKQIERCLELPAVYETVMTRAQLASRMYDLARDEERLCERLVHEQHLQQQGWSAVVANMEDVTEEFRRRFRNFFAAFERHLEQRTKYLELLRNFGTDLSQLARIPILPGLMPLAEADFHGFDEFLDTDEVFTSTQLPSENVSEIVPATQAGDMSEADDAAQGETTEGSTMLSIRGPYKNAMSPNKNQKLSSSVRRSNLNLLQWITTKENHNTLKLMSDECVQGLSTFNDKVYEQLKTEVNGIVKMAEQSEVKEIKGISERLCRLEEFKYRIKSMVQDQKELSTAFQQNQNRAINLRDPTILPDLCASHQSQLLVMQNNHDKIRELRRLIANAKDELGGNLHTRLKRIVCIENAMSEIDNRLLFYHRCLRRAEKHITIIEQIHQTPCIYVAAVTEVLRRKIFSGEFSQWASKLVEDFEIIHSEEVARRQCFNRSFDGHFLNILFPGMGDMPPPFANNCPSLFDVRLPNITKSDIDMLSSHLPELTHAHMQLPDMGPVIHFFVSRSGIQQRECIASLLSHQLETTDFDNGDGSPEKPVTHPRLSELQKDVVIAGCDESETDTETEFEKVVVPLGTAAATPSHMARSTITDALQTQSVSTLTEESESVARSEVARLRCLLTALSLVALDCINAARTVMDNARAGADKCRAEMCVEFQRLAEQWRKVCAQNESREHELQANNTELLLLREQLVEANMLRLKYTTMAEKVEELQEQLHSAQQMTAGAVADAREELIREHKTEIESLRCRFKLMTSMESRSPSEAGLDCVGATSGSDPNPSDDVEAQLAQLRATLEEEKKHAIQAAIELERTAWQSKLMFPLNTDSVMAKLLEEKERQLDQLREKDIMLTKENYQLKTRLDALTNEEANSWLKEKLEYLHRDKTRLEEELTMEKSRRIEMESSVRNATYEQPVTSALPRSKSSGSSHKYIVLDCCAKGDVVFVVWSMRHGQFMVVQDSPHMYFVHGDSLAALNLRLPVTADNAAFTSVDDIPIPMPYYAIGRVIEKEYCQARKDENRYRVTRGSKFYRIKLTPLSSRQMTRRDRLESFSTITSRSASHQEAVNSPGAVLRQPTPAVLFTSATSPNKFDATTGIATVVNATVSTSPTVITATVPTVSGTGVVAGFKERTISITSVTEEDDEPISLLGDRCHYISVSEEEETSDITGAMGATHKTPPSSLQSKILLQSVITEQQTTLSTLKRDLLLASADIPPEKQQAPEDDVIVSQAMEDNELKADTLLIAAGQGSDPATLPSTSFSMPIQDAAGSCSPPIPTSVGTVSEDSDEYRSLEAKDDTEFPISE